MRNKKSPAWTEKGDSNVFLFFVVVIKGIWVSMKFCWVQTIKIICIWISKEHRGLPSGCLHYANTSQDLSCWSLFKKASKAELSLCFNVRLPVPQDADICQCDVVLEWNKVPHTCQTLFLFSPITELSLYGEICIIVCFFCLTLGLDTLNSVWGFILLKFASFRIK